MGTILSHGQGLVINEIHYDPEDETSREEFIELYNPGDTAVDLGGWAIVSGVRYFFPAGTMIPASGYAVIGEDPGTMQSVYGVTALGPWDGGLSNGGEEIVLVDASGVVQDVVDYGVGFPWPTGARGGGQSMELIHPSLDNNLGGSWRSSRVPVLPELTLIPVSSGAWSWRTGETEASNPQTAWTGLDFVEDGTWNAATLPIGFGGVDGLAMATTITGMQRVYSSVFLRREFEIAPNEIPLKLVLKYLVDDGLVVYVNGNEVHRGNMPAGALSIADTASGGANETLWLEAEISAGAGQLREGTNVIAIQAFNTALGSNDFGIDLELIRPAPATDAKAVPSPGTVNTVFLDNAPPAIRQVRHEPTAPGPNDEVTITAKLTDPDGMGAVTLEYQAVSPGSYVRLTDAAYETNWQSVVMVDDGTGGDVEAGDLIYTAVIPANVQVHRRLVRYRISFADLLGASAVAPYLDDEQPNFAYFVYGEVPSWRGSFTPTSQSQTFPSELMGKMPIYHLIANATDVTNSQYNGGSDGVRFYGTLVYDGKVYDHITFNNRGEFSTYVAGKNKWRFHFNRARRFQAIDQWGKRYASDWGSLNLQPMSSPWAAMNRGMAGMDEGPTMRAYGLARVPASRTHYFSFRVIDQAAEASATSQFEGDLWGLYLAMEQPSGSFLDDRNLADGNVYKIEGGAGDKKEQGNTQVKDASDWNSFSNASATAQTEQWWRDNMHMPTYYSMRALNRFFGNVDIRTGANHYFYHEPTMGQWYVMPWDLDMMWIAETHQAGVIRQQNSILNHPKLMVEFRNRAREILDLLASDAAVDGGQIGQLLDEHAQMVNPQGESQTWADIDAFMWNHHPRTAGSLGVFSGQTNHKGNFYRTPFTDSRFGGTYTRNLISSDYEGSMDYILKYTTDRFTGANWAPGNGVPAGYGYEYLKLEARDVIIPNRPTLSYLGEAEYPADGLSFGSGSFSDPNGSQTFGKMRWRLAKVLAPGLAGYEEGRPRSYEIETVATSPDFTEFVESYQFPANVIEPGMTYRVRVQHEDNTGRTSHWSEPMQFVAGVPDTQLLRDNLVVSEVMYHPGSPNAAESLVSVDKNDFEFIELKNVSDSVTLDLSLLSVTAGISFDFADASKVMLAPGGYFLIVKNLEAFEARYGTGLPVVGTYPNLLSNAGEQLVFSYAGNTAVIDFTYRDRDPWPSEPDGSGVSLVLIDPDSVPNHNDPANWRAGTVMGGTPGGGEEYGSGYLDWAAGYFSEGELGDSEVSGPNADPDGDGMENLLEYALGADPKNREVLGDFVQSSLATLPEGTNRYLSLTYLERVEKNGLEYQVQVGTDLVEWNEGSVEFAREDLGSGMNRVTVRSVKPVDEEVRQFVRLKVSTQ